MRKTTLATEFSLGTTSSIWALLYGGLAITGNPPSHTLAELPFLTQIVWGCVVVTAGVVTLVGILVTGDFLTIARGMTLMAAGMSGYGLAIIASSGWGRGGQAAGLTVAFAMGLVVRSYRLRWRLRHDRIPERGR